MPNSSEQVPVIAVASGGVGQIGERFAAS